jgi:hypothetical protein
LREIGRLKRCAQLSNFDADKVQQPIHEFKQPQSVAVEQLQIPRRRRRLAGNGIFNGAQYERKRSSQLVAHIAEERSLGAVQFGQLFRAFSFLVIGVGVGDAGGDLAGDEIEEPLVKGIVLPIGIERGNEDANWRRPVIAAKAKGNSG